MLPELIILEKEIETPNLNSIDCKDVEIWRDEDGTVCAYGYREGDERWMHLPELASFCLGDNSQEVKAIPHPQARKELIIDTYYRSVLPMMLQSLGTEVLHAGAVLTRHGVIALCANSGTGKSSITFALSRRGYQLWADDAVAFEVTNGGVRSLPLPFKIRLLPDALDFFKIENEPSLSVLERDPSPLALLLVLKRVPIESNSVAVSTVRLTPVQALPAILTHAYCFSLNDQERKQKMIEHYLELVERVPVFEIRFQPGLENLQSILDGIESVQGLI
jgi:hypothetical protein